MSALSVFQPASADPSCAQESGKLPRCWGPLWFQRWSFSIPVGLVTHSLPSAVEIGTKGVEGLGLSAQAASSCLQRGGFCPSPWGNLLPPARGASCCLLSTMPARLYAVCRWFAWAFDFTKFWGPLAFLGVLGELTVHQGAKQDFCRVFGFFLLCHFWFVLTAKRCSCRRLSHGL